MTNKDYNTITVFKYFISFLEVWKEENYGPSAEINWQAVWGFVNCSGILDGNYELTDLVNSNPDDVEKNIHEWLENRVLNNEPVYLLFEMTPWLKDKLEKEHNENLNAKEIQRFNECRCYKCKHWRDNVSIWVQQYDQLHTYHPGECDDKLWEQHPIHHMTECLKHKELVDELSKDIPHFTRFDFLLSDYRFEYEPFSNLTRTGQFYPVPTELTDCPYFEDTGITYDEYIKRFKELA